jgi:hypothetical protein
MIAAGLERDRINFHCGRDPAAMAGRRPQDQAAVAPTGRPTAADQLVPPRLPLASLPPSPSRTRCNTFPARFTADFAAAGDRSLRITTRTFGGLPLIALRLLHCFGGQPAPSTSAAGRSAARCSKRPMPPTGVVDYNRFRQIAAAGIRTRTTLIVVSIPMEALNHGAPRHSAFGAGVPAPVRIEEQHTGSTVKAAA